MIRTLLSFLFVFASMTVLAVGVRVGPDCNILLTDSNPAGSVTETIFRWGSTPGDRTNSFTQTGSGNTTCGVVGITAPGQYHLVAVAVAGGVEANESNEVPFELPPAPVVLDVQP